MLFLCPVVLCENFVSPFKFWLEDTLHEGILYQDELFGCLDVFSDRQRTQVYELSNTLSQQGIQVVITHKRDRSTWKSGSGRYKLWINLRQKNLLSSLSDRVA